MHYRGTYWIHRIIKLPGHHFQIVWVLQHTIHMQLHLPVHIFITALYLNRQTIPVIHLIIWHLLHSIYVLVQLFLMV